MELDGAEVDHASGDGGGGGCLVVSHSLESDPGCQGILLDIERLKIDRLGGTLVIVEVGCGDEKGYQNGKDKGSIAIQFRRYPLGERTGAALPTVARPAGNRSMDNQIIAKIVIDSISCKMRARRSGGMFCLTGSAYVADLRSRSCMPLHRQ
jgi:hypothetical protein